MPIALADMLAQALTPQGERGQVPLLQQGRTRFPPQMQAPQESLPLLQQGRTRLPPQMQEAPPEGYFTDPLLNVGRSRFPPGVLEGLGLGAARRR